LVNLNNYPVEFFKILLLLFILLKCKDLVWGNDLVETGLFGDLSGTPKQASSDSDVVKEVE
jgi:hypothetical protein